MDNKGAYQARSALMRRPAVEVLRIARRLLNDPQLWTQEARARDLRGRPVRPNSPKAACWSLGGALAVASNQYGITPPTILRMLDLIVREWGMVDKLWPDDDTPGPEIWECAEDYNDIRPHHFVLALLDEAIKRCSVNNQDGGSYG